MLNMPFWATSLISRSRLGAIGDPYSASATTSAKTGLPSRTQRVSFRDGRKASAATKRRRSRSEEHTSELQSLMRISYAVFCLKKKIKPIKQKQRINKKT